MCQACLNFCLCDFPAGIASTTTSSSGRSPTVRHRIVVAHCWKFSKCLILQLCPKPWTKSICLVMAAAGEAEGRSPLLQLKAIEALGRLREPDAVPVLKNLFEAKRMFKWAHHRELRIAAAQALAKIDPRYATQIMADSGLEPGELAIGPLDSAPACPWVRQRRYERILLRRPITATISSSWGKSTISVHEMSL